MDKSALVPAMIGAVIGYLVAAYAAPAMPGIMMRGGAPVTATARLDAHFIEQMIPHHEGAILMAELALERSERPEIRDLAEDIRRTQADEIARMRAWYKEWFGREVPTRNAGMHGTMGHDAMGMGMMGDAADLDALRAAADFDKAFIGQMIPHHQMAVMMVQMLRASDRPEMTRLAEDVIGAQTREIEAMRGWYRDWYGP
jgi:uncharacterized protein (DUF305 family)